MQLPNQSRCFLNESDFDNCGICSFIDSGGFKCLNAVDVRKFKQGLRISLTSSYEASQCSWERDSLRDFGPICLCEAGS